ncbi:MAG TPA: NAD(P)/FAD-dependent oxidoreductase [Gemmatimonadales bacterium]|nr:NAD(P)/FAD-dependent oxidoreductase [Gemmatimonadales bacterium]
MAEVGIVGGGILGMTLAAKLTRQGHRVTILEAATRSGGLAAPAEIGGYTWDRFYHVILLSDSHLRGLLDELGLGDRLHWNPTRTGFYLDGRLLPLSSTLDFLTFPALGLLDKARLGATILYASRIRDWRRLESETARAWLTRWSGPRAWDRLWRPLLRAKLGDNAEVASAAFIWAIIARMYGARRTGMKRETFGYVDGGYASILGRLDARLRDLGVETQYGARATEVRRSGGHVVVTTTGGVRQFDHVVLTIPSGRIADVCPQLGDAERARLRAVRYQGIACAALLLEQPLADCYITNIADPEVPFTAVIEMTALVDRRTFGGHALVYLPKYLTQEDPFWQRTDAEIESEFLAALERMYPRFRRSQVKAFQLSRVRDMLAVTTLDYSAALLPPTATSIDGIFIVNSAQIANGTLNVNETVALASRKADELEPVLRDTTLAPRRAAGAA